MQTKISRRTLVKSAIAAGAFIPALGFIDTAMAAAALPALDPGEPTAKALGYVNDSASVDAKVNPTHKAEQKCGNCAQFQGKAGDARGGCNIFAGKSVAAGGWCKVWAKKPGT